MCPSPFDGTKLADRSAKTTHIHRTQAVLLIEAAAAACPQKPLGWSGDGHLLAPDPLLAAANERCDALERALPKGWRVFYAVHNGRPSIAEALTTIREAGIERLIAIPMRPQFCGVSGTELGELYRCLGEFSSDLHVEVRPWWHDDAAYVDAHAKLIHTCASERGLTSINSVLVFWANLPEASDLESNRVRQAAEHLRKRLGWSTQRAATLITGPGTQSLRDTVYSLGADEGTSVLLCPIVHMSVASQLGAELEALLRPYRDEGGGAAHICPPPGSSEEFIKALSLLVRRGRAPISGLRNEPEPLLPPMDLRALVEKEIGTLMMAGVSVHCSLGQCGGPKLHYCDATELRTVKRPHMETVALLNRVGETLRVRECWIWNTCSRYEFYAWARPGSTPEETRQTLFKAMDEVLGSGARKFANLFTGRAVWRHALRTASGLNSALVGDAEVVEQLRAAKSAALYAGSAGELTDAFIENLGQAVRDLRAETTWGEYAHRYCDIALSRLTPSIRGAISRGKCVVVGGSTTSCSVLETLRDRFRVPQDNISLIYRGHRKGTLIKRLKEAVGEGAITIVDDYSSPSVLATIARADFVVFALDQRQPVFTGAALQQCRDLAARPLTIVDFNTFDSIASAEDIAGLRFINAARIDSEVSSFNREQLASPRLGAAVRHAETWIARHVGSVGEPGDTCTAGGCASCTKACCLRIGKEARP
jgi:glutamyl-tRNA reductase/protoheme ferro-lyase